MMNRPSLDLAVIGNSNIAALIDRDGRIVWTCWPRIDGDPVFCALVDGKSPDSGFFSIAPDEAFQTEQSYTRNTAILRTVVSLASGASYAITDFVPRFRQYGRTYRPPMIVRRLEPISGMCRIRVRIRPRMGYGQHRAAAITGSNHIRYVTEAGAIRLTTDASVSYVADEAGFVLTKPVTLIVHSDEPLPDSIPRIAREFHDQTRDYWLDWARYLNVPYEWQEAVIRAAITLQLCSFEETGAIVAALTTSIPEAPESARNWDYRYCWIRDAFFTVHALNRVGATPTMERFIDYVANVIAVERGPALKPVYGLFTRSASRRAGCIGASGLSRVWPRTYRQCRRRPDTTRRVWERDSRRLADVLRRAAPEERRYRPLQSARAAWHARAVRCAHSRCGHMGISRQDQRAHIFSCHVLGRLRPPCPHCRSSRADRSRPSVGDVGSGSSQYDPRKVMERATSLFLRLPRQQRDRRQRLVAARAWHSIRSR